MQRACATPAEMRFFCEAVSDETTKSLDLLQHIEDTVFWLSFIQDKANADAGLATKAADAIKACERTSPIDPDGQLINAMEHVENRLNDLYNALLPRQDAARRAAELDGEDKELIVDEYAKATEAVSQLHEAMHELRWAVMEHDADFEKDTGVVYDSVDKMFADIGL
jgi:hypothetical protein